MKKVLLLILAVFCLPAVAQTQEIAALIDWPATPTPREPEFITPTSPTIREISPPYLGFPERDPSHDETTDKRFRGILVYAPVAGLKPHGQRFIVLRDIGQKSKADERMAEAASYRINFTLADNIHTPVFSPDGKQLLFQQGSPFGADEDAGSWSYLYCWNFDAKQWGFYTMSSPSVAQNWANDNLHFMQHIERAPPDEVWHRTEISDALIFDVRDRVSKQEHNSVPSYRSPKVFSSRTLRWSNQGTVFGTQEVTADNAKPVAVEWQPYTQKINVISPAAFDPAPSPDGRYIAYFGWPGAGKIDNPAPVFLPPPTLALSDVAVPQQKPADFSPDGPFLYLLERKTGRKSLVNLQSSGLLAWTSDGQNLVVSAKTFGADAREKQAHIRTISLVQMTGDLPPNVPRQMKEIATLSATDFMAMQRGTPPNFRILSIARHGQENWLYLDISAYTAPGDLYTEEKRIEAVNLQSGEVVTLSRLTSVYGSTVGWDFHDDADETVRPIRSIGPPKVKAFAPAKPKAPRK